MQQGSGTGYGSVDLVKHYAARGYRFERFNSGFVKVYPLLPMVSAAGIKDPLNRFIAEAMEGRKRYAPPVLVRKGYFDAAVAELGYNPMENANKRASA